MAKKKAKKVTVVATRGNLVLEADSFDVDNGWLNVYRDNKTVATFHKDHWIAVLGGSHPNDLSYQGGF